MKGVSSRKVDDLVRVLGIDGISRSEVPRICKALDQEVRTFLARPIEVECPFVWLDAMFHKVREAGRVVSVATVVAIGASTTGERTVRGAATGPSEDHQFLDLVPSPARQAGPEGRPSGHLRTPMRACVRRSRRSCTRPRGSAAESTSCATCSRSSPSRRRTRSQRSSARSPPCPTMTMTQLHEVTRMLG